MFKYPPFSLPQYYGFYALSLPSFPLGHGQTNHGFAKDVGACLHLNSNSNIHEAYV